MEENAEEGEVRDTLNTEKEVEDLDVVGFQFRFDAPCIQLHLITESIRRSTSAQVNQLAAPDHWRLNTYLEQLSVNFQSSSLDSNLDVKIKSLVVSDNSGDERFPVIFEN